MKIRKIVLLLTAFLMVTKLSVKAHEGMWIPSLIKMFLGDMQADGLRLSAEDIYSVNKSSLKDAIVHFGGGCTAEVVSTQGLILTNHHCGFSQIQSHSSLENDYLKDGFWAMNKSEELTNPGLTATFIVRIEDVTATILEGITDGMDEETRSGKIRTRIATLEQKVSESEEGHSAQIKAFYYGNEYYMIVTKTYNDVRLVGAPPSSIGKYGGDTDNWMWPRHTGDFSVFRIYAGKDNEPAGISDDNVPYKPGHAFPVSVKGTKPGDFTMVYGFPGRTQQYLHSRAVKYITQTMNPHAIKMRESSLEIIDNAMASSDQIRIQYAAKQARISNAYKKWIGENRGLERLNAIEKKEKLESDFNQAVSKSVKLNDTYGKVVGQLNGIYDKGEALMSARSMLIEFFYMGPEFIRHTSGFVKLVDNFEDLEEKGELEAEITRLKKSVENFHKNYQPWMDQQILAVLYPQYIKGLAPELRPGIHTELSLKYAKNWDKYASDLFEKSYFVSKEKKIKLLAKVNKGTIKKIKKDPAYRLMKSVLGAWREKAVQPYIAWDAELSQLMRVYVKGMMKVFPDKNYWPDANSTLRLAWGKVMGSNPADGIKFHPFTSLDGVMEKYQPGHREFDLPDRMLELAKKRDYGRYADNGKLPVCFTATNHTTGGNSGSPVLDADGNLIGINFDRSWESTMSDIMYDPVYCRNIIVDIRYVLFVIDKFAGATHLVDEMTLVEK